MWTKPPHIIGMWHVWSPINKYCEIAAHTHIIPWCQLSPLSYMKLVHIWHSDSMSLLSSVCPRYTHVWRRTLYREWERKEATLPFLTHIWSGFYAFRLYEAMDATSLLLYMDEGGRCWVFSSFSSACLGLVYFTYTIYDMFLDYKTPLNAKSFKKKMCTVTSYMNMAGEHRHNISTLFFFTILTCVNVWGLLTHTYERVCCRMHILCLVRGPRGNYNDYGRRVGVQTIQGCLFACVL